MNAADNGRQASNTALKSPLSLDARCATPGTGHPCHMPVRSLLNDAITLLFAIEPIPNYFKPVLLAVKSPVCKLLAKILKNGSFQSDVWENFHPGFCGVL